ncbi:MAG TPA: hypothetical protein PL009_14665 [Flavipsychrobacter sp.]|nr:hypothetical protein [Flavipsychrobacter sp.]
MKQLYCGFLLVLLAFSSCKKEVGENQKLDPKNQKKYDLMTNKTGSWWLYGGSDSTVSVMTATGRDSTIKGLFFSYYERVDTTSAERNIMPEFFGKNTSRYVTLVDLDGTYTQFITVIFFKEDVPIGEKWTNIDNLDYLGLKFDVKVESRLVEMAGNMAINGKIYTDVKKIHHEFWGRIDLGIPSDYTDIGFMDVWFVKGIGIIKKDLNVTIAAGNFSKVYRDSLLDYYFVPE